MDDAIEEIHRFWFGELSADGRSPAEQHSLWFSKSDITDTLIKERFGALLECARAGDLDHWRQTDRGLIALVVLLDQFSRNIHRDTAAAFSADRQALSIALDAIERGMDKRMPAIHRVFLYLPLEHAENTATQQRSVELFQELANGADDLENFASYAVAHRDVIDRFGRFPHRNAILGRASTDEEVNYLATHGGF